MRGGRTRKGDGKEKQEEEEEEENKALVFGPCTERSFLLFDMLHFYFYGIKVN